MDITLILFVNMKYFATEGMDFLSHPISFMCIVTICVCLPVYSFAVYLGPCIGEGPSNTQTAIKLWRSLLVTMMHIQYDCVKCERINKQLSNKLIKLPQLDCLYSLLFLRYTSGFITQ